MSRCVLLAVLGRSELAFRLMLGGGLGRLDAGLLAAPPLIEANKSLICTCRWLGTCVAKDTLDCVVLLMLPATYRHRAKVVGHASKRQRKPTKVMYIFGRRFPAGCSALSQSLETQSQGKRPSQVGSAPTWRAEAALFFFKRVGNTAPVGEKTPSENEENMDNRRCGMALVIPRSAGSCMRESVARTGHEKRRCGM